MEFLILNKLYIIEQVGLSNLFYYNDYLNLFFNNFLFDFFDLNEKFLNLELNISIYKYLYLKKLEICEKSSPNWFMQTFLGLKPKYIIKYFIYFWDIFLFSDFEIKNIFNYSIFQNNNKILLDTLFTFFKFDFIYKIDNLNFFLIDNNINSFWYKIQPIFFRGDLIFENIEFSGELINLFFNKIEGLYIINEPIFFLKKSDSFLTSLLKKYLIINLEKEFIYDLSFNFSIKSYIYYTKILIKNLIDKFILLLLFIFIYLFFYLFYNYVYFSYLYVYLFFNYFLKFVYYFLLKFLNIFNQDISWFFFFNKKV